ncbi:MAG: hypothetical protein HC801_07860, partial [Nitrospira sp.]|nr:hypothetical protein [Nitrospira sp.]
NRGQLGSFGVPGETDQDVEEGIALILKNRKYIGRLANINPLILVNGSVYWIDPASHNIVLKESQETMYEKYPRALPADQWHSTDPYIDAQVRKERFERIVLALHDAGFNVGAWANRVIEDVKFNRDKARTGSSNEGAISAGEFEVAGGNDTGNILSLTEEERALEVASQRSPLAEENHTRTTRPIPMYAAQDAQSPDAGKPLAEPPLFGIAGESPRKVREMSTHTILFYNGWYFGIPAALGSVDVTSPESSAISGILRYPTEAEVLAAIEESARWANSRGHYDDQQKQRTSGSYMRVDSVGEMSEPAEIPSKPRILQFDKMYIAVNQDVLMNPFGRRSVAERKSKSQEESKRTVSVWRQIAERLPASFEMELRRLIRQERFNRGNGAYLSDLQLARMLPRAVAVAYVKEPLKRLRRLVTGRGFGTNMPAGVPVEGKDFSILSVVTQNAQPELLWTIGNYNLVKFDGKFYGIPHGAYVEWDSGLVASIPDMLLGDTIAEVDGMIRKLRGEAGEISIAATSGQSHASGFAKSPVLLRTMHEEGYDVISYEGWIYGMPHALGSIDLAEIDVIEMPGVIRDVSRDAVENEILALGQSHDRSGSTVEV